MATLYADKKNNDRILGTEENDVIIGGDAHDILSGGREQSGSDYIDGGLGNDYLVGDNSPGSNDTLTGGAGSDTFVIADSSRLGSFEGISSDNAVYIRDYSSEDTISFSVSNFDSLHDVHYGSGGSDGALTFIYDDSNELLATISGTEHLFLPS